MSTPVQHRAAGLVISADRRLPGFLAAPADWGPDVRIHLDARPPWHGAVSVTVYVADDLDAGGSPIVRVSRSPDGFHLHYADRTRVWIDRAGADVWCTWPASATLEDTCTYLCGPVLGLLLRLRGALALHASAVQVGGGAVGFVGPHGAGKSTIAAALGAAGHRVVTDDVLHLRAEGARWIAEPFASMLKLWPRGAQLALGAAAELPVIAAGWDKRALYLDGEIPGATSPLPLLALAWLAPREAAAQIRPVPAGTALVHLAANSSAGHLLDTPLRAAEFAALSSLVRTTPCVAITAPEAPAAFPQFVERVLEWVRPLRPPD